MEEIIRMSKEGIRRSGVIQEILQRQVKPEEAVERLSLSVRQV
ncbi:MAG TPA: hypothetical protein PK644_05590 [bacterium]|nr:hypothetical protein [bacterium]